MATRLQSRINFTYPKYYQNSNKFCTFAAFGQIGHSMHLQGTIEISVILQMYPTFEGGFFHVFIDKTNTKSDIRYIQGISH